MQALDINSLHQSYTPVQFSGASTAPSQTKSSSPGGVKGFLINNLPAIGGGIGAVAGIPLDFLGGAGSVVGGSGGAAIGEVLKEKALGQNLSAKQVGIQAAEGGATGLLGGAAKGVQGGAKALTQVGIKEASPIVSTEAKDTLAIAKPTITQKIGSALANKGDSMEAKLGSYAPGQKVGGQQLDTAASNKISNTLKDENIGGLSAPERLSSVEGKIGLLQDANKNIVTANDRELTPEEKTTLSNEFNQRLSNEAGGTAPTVQKYANTYSNELGSRGKLSDLLDYKHGLDNNEINYKTTTDASSNARNIAAKTARSTVSDFLSNALPETSGTNERLSNLHSAKGALLNASGKLANLSTSGEGLTGRLLSSETAEKGKAIIAKGAQKTGEVINPEEKAISKQGILGNVDELTPKTTPTQNLVGNAKSIASFPVRAAATPIAQPVKSATSIGKQLLARSPASLISGVQHSQTATPTPQTPQYGTSSLNTSAEGFTDNSSTADSSQYSEANMLYDINRDPQNASTYETLYKTVNPAPTSSSLDNLTTNQKNQLTGSQNAISALQGYLGQIQNVQKTGGTDTGVIGGRVGSILGKYGLGGQPAANTYSLATSSRDVATQVAAGLSPTGRGTTSQIEGIEASLPKVTDSPTAAQAKVTQMIERLQEVMKTEATPLSTYVGSSAGGSDTGSQLADLLATTGQQ